MKTRTGNTQSKLISTEQQENIKNSRRTLKVLQQTASDKENLAGRPPKSKDIFKPAENEMSEKSEIKKKRYANKSIQTEVNKNISVADLTSEEGPSENYWVSIAEKRRIALEKTRYANKSIQTEVNKNISVEDLTSEEGPSENYWESIAEKRRIALEKTLEENKTLYEKITKLTEENEVCKETIRETKNLVEVLTEMLEDKDTSTTDLNVAESPSNIE